MIVQLVLKWNLRSKNIESIESDIKEPYLKLYDGVPAFDNAKNFLETIGLKFKKSNKAEVTNL